MYDLIIMVVDGYVWYFIHLFMEREKNKFFIESCLKDFSDKKKTMLLRHYGKHQIHEDDNYIHSKPAVSTSLICANIIFCSFSLFFIFFIYAWFDKFGLWLTQKANAHSAKIVPFWFRTSTKIGFRVYFWWFWRQQFVTQYESIYEKRYFGRFLCF